MDESDDNCQSHPHHRRSISHQCRLRRTESFQSIDEKNRGNQVGKGKKIGTEFHNLIPYFFFLNIGTIRLVTTNPPKILIEAKNTAKKPITLSHCESVFAPATKMAP